MLDKMDCLPTEAGLLARLIRPIVSRDGSRSGSPSGVSTREALHARHRPEVEAPLGDR